MTQEESNPAIESLMPDDEDLLYEEEILRNPYSVKLWWRYIQARHDAPPKKRYLLFERAINALPGSYKLWNEYLGERIAAVRGFCITHHAYESLNNTFERALVTMHKMPRIWLMYLDFLKKQYLITRTRRTFDRALAALPITQHDRIWQLYLDFVTQKGFPIETAKRVYKRYLKLEPLHAEEYVTFLKSKECWGEAAKVLADLVNDDNFSSLEGKSKYQLWLELCEIITKHPLEVKETMNVESIIRGGIRKFTDEVSHLWTSLADYFIRQGMFERARDIYEEGLSTVITVHDFGLIFDAFAQFEESLINAQMENSSLLKDDDSDDEETIDIGENFLTGDDGNDLDLRISRLENLMIRRPILLSSVVLRQNPHNVHEWHKRVKLFKGNPTKQILTYTEAVKTVDSDKATGKPHSLWCAFAKFYEHHNDIHNARVIFEKASQVKFKYVDDLAQVWCEYAEMELRHQNFKLAIEVMKRATTQTYTTKKRLTKDEYNNLTVQDKLYKNLKIWSFYVDLEESLGDIKSTCAIYDKILDYKIATPQIILNYALYLQENKYWEESFRVYERGVTLFKFPHASDIWSAYLHYFVERYKGTKAERTRDLFEQVINQVTPEQSKQFFLSYANFEETYGLAKHAMLIYDKAVKTVPITERLAIYDIYVTKALKFFGVTKVRDIYQRALEAEEPYQLSDEDCKVIYMKFAELEKKLGELDRARALYIHASYLSNPANEKKFWEEWNQFEICHGNEDTFREMCRIKRSVAASYSNIHFNTVNIESMLHAQSDEDEELEENIENELNIQQPLQFGKFVRGETIQALQMNEAGLKKDDSNPEEISMDNMDDKDNFNIAEKEVPEAVFGGLKRKMKNESDNKNLGALERFKRKK